MEQPPSYEDSDRTKYCLKLYKSIYGLKQAGRKWYEIVCRTLADLGLKRSEADQAVFYAHIGKEIIILAIHVDDCTITGSSHSLIQQYKSRINSKYSMTDLGPVNWLLGIKVTRDLAARTLSLSQTSYIDSILQYFNFTDLKPYSMPMGPSYQNYRVHRLWKKMQKCAMCWIIVLVQAPCARALAQGYFRLALLFNCCKWLYRIRYISS